MKTKKFFLALLIFGGVMFTAQATNIVDLNEQTTTSSVPKNIKKPPQG